MHVCACYVASVMSDSLQPYGLQPTRLLCPWYSPGKDIGVGCHALPPGNLPDPGIEPLFLMSPALASRLFTTSPIWIPGLIRSWHSCGSFFWSWPAISRRMRAETLLRTCWLWENWVELRNQGNFHNSWVLFNSPVLNRLIQRLVTHITAAKLFSAFQVAFRERDRKD